MHLRNKYKPALNGSSVIRSNNLQFLLPHIHFKVSRRCIHTPISNLQRTFRVYSQTPVKLTNTQTHTSHPHSLTAKQAVSPGFTSWICSHSLTPLSTQTCPSSLHAWLMAIYVPQSCPHSSKLGPQHNHHIGDPGWERAGEEELEGGEQG